MFRKQQFIFLIFFTVFGLLFSARTLAAVPLAPTGHIPYKTFIYGADDVELKNVLRSASKLVAGQNIPPRTINELKQLAVQDMKNLQDVLGAQGYYDAEMDFFVEIETVPVTVYLKISLGKLYTLGAFKIKSDPPDNPQIPLISENITRLGIHMGMPAKKDKVKSAIDQVLKFLKDRGQPLAKIKEDRMVIDRASKELHVALLINAGPLVRFGNIVIENSGGVNADFIKGKLAWQKGDIYNREKIIQTIQKLHNSRLFKTIKITNGETVSDEGFMDIYVNLTGTTPSDYSIGAKYQPKQSMINTVKWESRNLMDRGEILSLQGDVGSKQKTGELALLLPDFQKINLDFIMNIRAGKWEFPAYVKQGIEMKSSVQYPIFGPDLIGEAGLSFEINNVEKNGEREDTYRILGFPFGIKYSDIIGGHQPRRGVRFEGKVYPYMTVFGKLQSYVRAHLNPEVFYPITAAEDVVVTGWLDAGFTPGAGKKIVPSHKLYYPGGADTIRGYKFQMAGPLDEFKNPKGGRSMVLFGAGVNSYVTDSLTISGYMDCGTAYDRQYGDFSSGMLWGIGAGIKYHTEYGDLSFDIASPVIRRKEDDAIEFYVSFNMKPYEVYQGLYRNFTPQAIQNSSIK